MRVIRKLLLDNDFSRVVTMEVTKRDLILDNLYFPYKANRIGNIGYEGKSD